METLLTKSRYMQGLQCAKLLWYAFNSKSSFPPISPQQQSVFDEGKRVHEFAQELFTGGLALARQYNPRLRHNDSQRALKTGKPLFEGGFLYKNSYCLADILVPNQDAGWDLYEVKSSTGVKEEYLQDLAFQKYTIENSGTPLGKCFLMHINSSYVRAGSLDPQGLFNTIELTAEAAGLQKELPAQIERMLSVAGQSVCPQVKIGPQCDQPYECPLKNICWEFLPQENNVFVLSKGKSLAFELVNRGIYTLADIPPDVILTEHQKIQVESHLNARPYVNRKALQEFLDKLVYPLYFLDFETIGPALPVYEMSSPYEQVPFQFSLQVLEHEAGKPQEYPFIASGPADPRREILTRLQGLMGDSGSIVAYYAPFEQKALQGAVKAYPEFSSWLKQLEKRFVDLLEPFKSFAYYHYFQAGHNSLKTVLPALSKISYKGMEINNGALASAEYYRITFGRPADEQDSGRVRLFLQKYCSQDTLGMVHILEELKRALAKT